jgi:hypothetical protein
MTLGSGVCFTEERFGYQQYGFTTQKDGLLTFMLEHYYAFLFCPQEF